MDAVIVPQVVVPVDDGGRAYKKPTTTTKFKGNCEELKGNIFDCSDSNQADQYVQTLKVVGEYCGANYKFGGDIRASIINETKTTITQPLPPMRATNYDPTQAYSQRSRGWHDF